MLSIRRDDVLNRRKYIDEENSKIDELSKKKEAQDSARVDFLESMKKECEEKGEDYVEETHLEEFNNKNAPIITEIPNKLVYDIDDDFLIEVAQN